MDVNLKHQSISTYPLYLQMLHCTVFLLTLDNLFSVLHKIYTKLQIKNIKYMETEIENFLEIFMLFI